MILAQPARAARNHALARCASEAAMVRLLRRFDAADGLLGRFPEMGREGQRAVTILDIRDSRRGN